MDEKPNQDRRFWIGIACANAVLWGIFGLVIGGWAAAAALSVFGYAGMFLITGARLSKEDPGGDDG